MPDTLTSEPLLRTLSPALGGLERSLRGWLDGTHRYPLSTIARATLEGLATDLHRQAEALDVDRPLLVIMLMGGTGVGKSSLLNALAGGSIAQASFTRPTTRDPVVYYHESVRPDRLDPVLRHCRLAQHDRAALAHKIIVDTPDLDSNDLANRDKLKELLPVADIVLYVGSQEKYHDKLGWELFLQQRKRRAFAFVLNKWDRCLHPGATGMRPDEDLIRDLKEEGFQSPLLFRTCAQHWIDRGAHAAIAVGADGAASHAELPEGEQFQELVQWLEMGLTRLEVEAIKARGVSQMLHHLEQALRGACPPDLRGSAERSRAVWQRTLDEESKATAEVLLNTLEPYQREIEHHFALQGQRRFHGVMALYLHLITRARYVGSTLRERVTIMPRLKDPTKEKPPAWDLGTFTHACSEAAATRHLDARCRALANRLLVEADAQEFPVSLLSAPVESASRIDWRQRHAQTLIEVLQEVEAKWSRPKGVRSWFNTILVFLADWLPLVVFLAALVNLLWHYFDPMGKGYQTGWVDVFLPVIVLLIVLIILHILITLLLPLRWSKIRGEFQHRLEDRLHEEMEKTYGPIPGDVADGLQAERKQVEQVLRETNEVATWLEQREQAASVSGLYGH
jgi:energy-coupling factor transporter ATP-binding protein EcfA2